MIWWSPRRAAHYCTHIYLSIIITEHAMARLPTYGPPPAVPSSRRRAEKKRTYSLSRKRHFFFSSSSALPYIKLSTSQWKHEKIGGTRPAASSSSVLSLIRRNFICEMERWVLLLVLVGPLACMSAIQSKSTTLSALVYTYTHTWWCMSLGIDPRAGGYVSEESGRVLFCSTHLLVIPTLGQVMPGPAEIRGRDTRVLFESI